MKFWNKDKTKGFIIGILIAVVLMIVIKQAVLWLPVSVFSKKADSELTNLKIKQTMQIIRNHYIDDYDEADVEKYIFIGMLSALDDPYAAYYTKEDYEPVSMKQDGEYKGIGVAIAIAEDGSVMIDSITEDGPAQKCGLKSGDEIVSIDGNTVKGLSVSEVKALITQNERDDVVLEIFRVMENSTFEVTVTKERLESYSVAHGVIEDEIGYIAVTSFTNNTAKQFASARAELEEKGITGLIIDLRDNRGGMLYGARDMLGNFVDNKLIVSEVYKDGSRNEIRSSDAKEFEYPVVLLVNEYTASAAEIVAGCIKDYEVATIVGTTTFGKGIVQEHFRLRDDSIIKLTTAHYYTPNGSDIHKVGVEPDIIVENNEEEDLQMLKALEILGVTID